MSCCAFLEKQARLGFLTTRRSKRWTKEEGANREDSIRKAPRSYLSSQIPRPTQHPPPPPPNATNLFPLKDLAAPGRRRRRVRQENQVTRVAASLPPSPQPVSCNNSISPFRPPSPSGTMQQIAMSRRSTPRGRQSLSPFARKHPPCPDYSRYRKFDAGLADARLYRHLTPNRRRLLAPPPPRRQRGDEIEALCV